MNKIPINWARTDYEIAQLWGKIEIAIHRAKYHSSEQNRVETMNELEDALRYLKTISRAEVAKAIEDIKK